MAVVVEWRAVIDDGAICHKGRRCTMRVRKLSAGRSLNDPLVHAIGTSVGHSSRLAGVSGN